MHTEPRKTKYTHLWEVLYFRALVKNLNVQYHEMWPAMWPDVSLVIQNSLEQFTFNPI